MRKFITLLLSLFVFTAVNAKHRHTAKHTAAHKHCKGRHVVKKAVRKPKLDAAILAEIDTCSASKYTGIQYLLYVLVKELGKPYKIGSCGPSGFDCSGLMNYAFSIIGVQLPRTSSDIGQIGQRIAFDALKPGDLLFFTGRNSRSRNRRIGHVGCVYKVDNKTGKVLMIHSSEEGVNITDITNSKYYQERFIGARRILGFDSCGAPCPVKIKG